MPDERVSDGTQRKLTDSVFAEVRKRVSGAYKAAAHQRVLPGSRAAIDFSKLADGAMDDAGTLFVDCETAFYTTGRPVHAWADHQAKRTGSTHSKSWYVPILYSAREKRDQSDDLLVCFGALGIAHGEGSRDRAAIQPVKPPVQPGQSSGGPAARPGVDGRSALQAWPLHRRGDLPSDARSKCSRTRPRTCSWRSQYRC
jgi:hypothetical protein